MPNMPWFRYYSEVARDRKVLMAAKAAGLSKIEMIGAWSIILCLASESPQRGNLLVTLQERFTVTDIETELCIDPDKCEKIITALLRYEMLEQDPEGTYSIKHWQKRQFESDNSTPRVEKHREKQAENVSETLQKRFRNAPDTDTDTDTDSLTRAPKKNEPIIKNQRAYDALKKNEERKSAGEADVSWLPECLRPLAQAFITASDINPTGKERSYWHQSLMEIWEAHIKPDILIKAVKKMRKEELTIKGPGSCLAVARDLSGRKNGGEEHWSEVHT